MGKGKGTTLGKNIRRKDGLEKVTGAAQYVDDLKFGPSLLHGKILHSPHPHALILNIDSTEAQKLPGVKAVITGKDFPNYVGLYLVDRTFLATDKVRYEGEPVAAVAATTPEIAEEALKLIKVSYKLLGIVTNPIDGAKKDAPLIHENLHKYKCVDFIFPTPHTNISNHFKLRKGDVDKGFDEADYIVEGTYELPHIQHAPLEPHVAVAQRDRTGKLTIWSASQSPNAVRKTLSVSLEMPLSKIRVITPYVGGGFGGKAGATIEGIAAALAMASGNRPVKLRLTREEVFRDTFVRQGIIAKIKSGVKKDGRILAQESELYWDGGAYTEYGVNITRSGGYCSAGPYEIPNIKTDSYCVYTNHPIGGPYRGFGMPEVHWAVELQMEKIAKTIGVDSVVIRKINCFKEGSLSATGEIMKGVGLKECIELVEKKLQWGHKKPAPEGKAIGKGIACMFKAPSMPPNASSAAIVKINEDGTINLLTTAMEIGQGSLTVLAQIAAETLGFDIDKIEVNTPDTDYTPYEWQTVASRITYSAGNAVKNAAQDAREQILKIGEEYFKTPVEALDIQDGWVYVKNNPEKRIEAHGLIMGIMKPEGGVIGGPVVGRGNFIPEGLTGLDKETGQGEKPAAFWTFGCQGVEVEVDLKTGHTKVLTVAAAYDIGNVLHPQLCEAQVQGGIVQGMGSALFEEMVLENGKLKNPNFVDYKIPTSMDMPNMIIDFVQTPLEEGPFGARGFAEHTMVPTAPAIANAVYDAIGVQINKPPLSAEKVYWAIKEGQK
jgi:CO/xanthine dehydrogenase Mo-binding subunit